MKKLINGTTVPIRCWVTYPNTIRGMWIFDSDLNRECMQYINIDLQLPIIDIEWQTILSNDLKEMDYQLYKYLYDNKIDGFVIKTRTADMPWMQLDDMWQIGENMGATRDEHDERILKDLVEVPSNLRLFTEGYNGISMLYGNIDAKKINEICKFVNDSNININVEKIPVKNEIIFISPFYLNGDDIDYIIDTGWRFARYEVIKQIIQICLR